ncbi:putative ribonuclease H-like domain-containing protein [Tanacetum coccineum]
MFLAGSRIDHIFFVPAGRTFSAGWKNNAARPMTRPTSHYFQHFHRPGFYNQMSMDEGRWGTAVKPSAGCSWRIQRPNMQWGSKNNGGSHQSTWNKSSKNKRFRIVGGTVTFGGGDGKITRKGTIRTSKLNFENVYYVEELQNFNLFSVSQICDTKNKVLFTDKECLDETYGILKDFITFIENQLTKKVKAIRCDNGTEFKNSNLIELCGSKGIRRDYSNARTPQQNGVAERKNRTLIEAARTMLADSKLPTMFWTEAVSTACYVLNRVLVTKPHNKTPYELVSGKVPNISHLKPFGCLVTILNTSDHLGKFEGKADEGFIVGYAAHSKAYRVYNLSSKKIEETLNLRYLEDKPNVQGLGHEWYFDLDYLTDSLGYTRFKTKQPAGTQDTNIHAGTQEDSDSECDEQVILVPSFPSNSFSGPKVNEASEVVESSSDYAEELARLQKNRVPAGKVDSAAGVTDGPTESSAPVFTPVHIDATSLPPGHSLGSSEHSTRYPSPSVGSIRKLVPLPDGKIAIGTKWILKNKRDARGIVVRNKARLVAQGHRQEEGIDYEEVYVTQERFSLFVLEAIYDSDYAGSHGDKENPTSDVSVLGRRFISQRGCLALFKCYSWTVEGLLLMKQEFLLLYNVSSSAARIPTGSVHWYALTNDPIIFDSLVKQFWSTASLRAPELGSPAILATIDRTPYTITEDTVRRQLQLGDDGGIDDLPIADIYLGMDNLGYSTKGKLTFYKNKFSPQWRFLVHTIQHCLSSKSGSWDQFGSPLAIALICLSDRRRFSWSHYIFKGMVHNISNAKSKLFANMRLNFNGDHMPFLAAMLPPAQAAIADDGTGEVAPDAPQTIPETIQETRPEPDHSQEHLPTPPRTTTTYQIPPVFEQGHTSDPNIASFSGAHESDPELFTSTNVEDETLGGSFHTTPPRSTQVPLKVQPQEAAGCASYAHADCFLTGADVPPSPPHPTSDVPTTEVPTDVPSVGAPTGPSIVTPDQRKRQQKVLASAANYSDAAWDIILARLQVNPDLSSIIFEVEFTDDDFAARMVELVNTQRKELAEQRAKERRERPMTPSQLRQYMRTYVKNQGPAVYSTGWTMAQVQKLSPEQLQEEFDKIQRAVAFTRGLKRDGGPIPRASSKKLKTGADEVTAKAPSHGVPQEEAGATPSPNVSREEVAAPSHSQDILEVPVEVPSNIASTAQHTASSLKKVGTKKKRLGRKGVHPSQSTIPIEEGDPEAEHKVCLKYASDTDSASDDDTPVNLYAVVDWELLPTGLGSINAFYRLDNSRKYFTRLREILHLVTRADLMTIYGRVMTFYQDKKAEGVGLVLWGDLKVLMDSPEVNDGSDVWKNQHTWNIQSWKLYSFSGVHMLETVRSRSTLSLHNTQHGSNQETRKEIMV